MGGIKLYGLDKLHQRIGYRKDIFDAPKTKEISNGGKKKQTNKLKDEEAKGIISRGERRGMEGWNRKFPFFTLFLPHSSRLFQVYRRKEKKINANNDIGFLFLSMRNTDRVII